MKILFDQNVPRNLARHLRDHQVVTSAQMGWEELINGDLLTAAEAGGFEVFITCDQSLRYQQNLSGRKMAIIELTKSNWPSIKPKLEEVVNAVNKSFTNKYQTIECPYIYEAGRRRIVDVS